MLITAGNEYVSRILESNSGNQLTLTPIVYWITALSATFKFQLISGFSSPTSSEIVI